MNIQLRLMRQTHELMRRDLVRPHSFASERIGFLFAKVGTADHGTILILCTEYDPVADDNYVPDESVGARINSTAIRLAMQRILDTRSSCFHVHVHPHVGIPGLSRVDTKEIPPIISSFYNVDPRSPHGILLLSADSCLAFIWPPGQITPIQAQKIVIVGYPTEILVRYDHGQ